MVTKHGWIQLQQRVLLLELQALRAAEYDWSTLY